MIADMGFSHNQARKALRESVGFLSFFLEKKIVAKGRDMVLIRNRTATPSGLLSGCLVTLAIQEKTLPPLAVPNLPSEAHRLSLPSTD